MTAASYSAWRLIAPAVAVQTSAQSRHSRMHLTISVTFFSLRSQPVSATHDHGAAVRRLTPPPGRGGRVQVPPDYAV